MLQESFYKRFAISSKKKEKKIYPLCISKNKEKRRKKLLARINFFPHASYKSNGRTISASLECIIEMVKEREREREKERKKRNERRT